MTATINLPKGDGYIKLYRNIREYWVWQNEKLLKVWIWCLLRANHKEAYVNVVTGRGTTPVKVEPGQFIYGRKKAAEDLNMKESTVRNQIEKLENHPDGYIRRKSIGRQFSIVTVLNWDYWQKDCEYMAVGNGERDLEQPTRTTKGQPKDINNNNKNNKNPIYKDNNIEKPENLEHSPPDARSRESSHPPAPVDTQHAELDEYLIWETANCNFCRSETRCFTEVSGSGGYHVCTHCFESNWGLPVTAYVEWSKDESGEYPDFADYAEYLRMKNSEQADDETEEDAFLNDDKIPF